MKSMLIGAAAGGVAYFLLFRFAIKTSDEDQGFVQLSEGFGLDDIVLGGGSYLIANWVAKMAR